MLRKIISIKDKFDKKQSDTVLLQDFKPKIAIFTGAGISRESGLETFRDSDGLWNNYSIAEIATSSAIKNNFEKVNNFYNNRRREVLNAQPNLAHTLVRQLEEYFDVVVITQNVDNLHEKAGSSKVLHLHGEIMKSRPIANTKISYEQSNDILVGDRCPISNSQLRPFVVLFNEHLDEKIYYESRRHIREADILIVIGSSLQVEPAASLIAEGFSLREFYLIDPKDVDLKYKANYKHIKQIASMGLKQLMPELVDQAIQIKKRFEIKKGAL